MSPAATSRLLRRLNAGRVLDVLRASEALGVTDLVAATGLSRPTVDAVADELVGLGWVADVTGEAGAGARTARGRPGRRLAFRARAGVVAAVDLGAHTVRAAVADLRGDVVAEAAVALAPETGGAERLDVVRGAVARVLREAGVAPGGAVAACAGCTGGMDAATGAVLFTTALPGLTGVNLREELAGPLGPGVLVENDCNLAAIAERWAGAARGVDDLICVLAAERLGAGIVVGGRLVRGHAGAAGELPFFGGGAGEEGDGEGIAALARRLGGRPAEALFAAAAAGDRAAEDVVARSLRHAGRAVTSMALLLDPELVVIGGGIARAGEAVAGPLRRAVASATPLPPRVEASPLAERGVLLGAIRHALDHVEARLLDGPAPARRAPQDRRGQPPGSSTARR